LHAVTQCGVEHFYKLLLCHLLLFSTVEFWGLKKPPDWAAWAYVG